MISLSENKLREKFPEISGLCRSNENSHRPHLTHFFFLLVFENNAHNRRLQNDFLLACSDHVQFCVDFRIDKNLVYIYATKLHSKV
jgi:hypothetical protein